MRHSLILIITFVFSSSLYAQRLITAGPAITEIVVALGAQQEIVGTDNSSVLPQEVSAAKLGYIRQLPIEGILALRPDLLIGSSEMAPTSTLDSLRQAGVTVTVLPDSDNIDGVLSNIDLIAQQVNQPAAGERLHQQTQQQLNTLKARAQQLADKKQPRVIFLLIHEGRPAMIAGQGSTANTLITLAGGVNPAHHLRNYQTISAENLLQMQPDVILISARHGNHGTTEVFKHYPLLEATPAGKNKNVMLVNGKALLGGAGLSTIDEAQRLQEQLLQVVGAQ